MFGDFVIQHKKFSWRRTKPVTMRRLDFFLVSDKMELDISGCGFYAPVQSDHFPIFIKISPLQETARGPGYWKFNSSLVNDPTFVEKTKEIINEVAMNITNQFEDYRIGWEFLKYKVRQFSQVYSKRKACECREKRVNPEKRLKGWKVFSLKTLLQKKSLSIKMLQLNWMIYIIT